jgi:hypothetical protein
VLEQRSLDKVDPGAKFPTLKRFQNQNRRFSKPSQSQSLSREIWRLEHVAHFDDPSVKG